ncbi:T9SS type A sorting domain-containing protein [Pontibacter sp. G13]|uniref:T9SS type A sorting domain-containing protein n=1 Tax=Pontibacter sp. G13 TaxID=3074898 RepID=UPI00288AF1BB|nr:T9SS type A sorting domain-containing protein [Pontibacter sp. G13]WNJ19159.1 T9SS type A sorting domain-containing protein [Pontibacter sp. G13]
MKQIFTLLVGLLAGTSLLLAQSPVSSLPLDALCSEDGGPFAILGDTDAPGGGEAYIYERGSSQWNLIQTLTLADGDPTASPENDADYYVWCNFGSGNNICTEEIKSFGGNVSLNGDLAWVEFQRIEDVSSQGGDFLFFTTYNYEYLYRRSASGNWLFVGLYKGGQAPRSAESVHLTESIRSVLNPFSSQDTTDILVNQIASDGSFLSVQRLGRIVFDFDITFVEEEMVSTLSPDGMVATVSLIGPKLLPDTFEFPNAIKIFRKNGLIWDLEATLPSLDPSIVWSPESDLFESTSRVTYTTAQSIIVEDEHFPPKGYTVSGGNWVALSNPIDAITPPDLTVDGSQLFLPKLTWLDVSDEDSFVVYRQLGNHAPIPIASLCANVTAFIDTVDGFGQTYAYWVEAVHHSELGYVAGRNSDTVFYSMPGNVQRLDLDYTCYNPSNDSLSWVVSNPNVKDVPFVLAQWWGPACDTLWATGQSTVTFKTRNVPQDPNTFGDDNITGIWWIDENQTPDSPSDLVFDIPLAVTCAGRTASKPAQPAGNVFQGDLKDQAPSPSQMLPDLGKMGITLFPNPVVKTMHLAELPTESETEISLFDPAGREVLHHSTTGVTQIQIPVAQLPAGRYFLQVSISGQVMGEYFEKK